MKTVFVMGSLNLDLVMSTTSFPHAGETIKGTDFFTNPGGKGANQAVASAKQGAKTVMLGAVGNDHYGQELKKTASDYGVDGTNIRTKPGSSGIAVILLQNQENRIIIHGGANDRYTPEDAIEDLTRLAKKGDILVVQFEIPLAVLEAALPFAHDLGMTIIVNPAPAVANVPSTLYPYINILIPNEWEAASLAKVDPQNFDAKKQAETLYCLGVKNVIITLGEQGSLFYDGKKPVIVPAIKVKAVDTTAAGDTFVGTIAAELSFDHPLADAILRATQSAAITVTRKGAQQSIPTRQEVDQYFKK